MSLRPTRRLLQPGKTTGTATTWFSNGCLVSTDLSEMVDSRRSSALAEKVLQSPHRGIQSRCGVIFVSCRVILFHKVRKD